MAAKLIRDDLLESERVHKVPVEARWLYVTALLMADDVGLFEVNLFALARKSGINQDHLQTLLKSLAVVDLIRPYEADKKPFAFIPRYQQRLQIKRAKCPLPPETLLHGDEDAVSKIKHLTSIPRRSTVAHGNPPPEPEPEPKRKRKTPLTPKGGWASFHKFWETWPKSPRKGGREKCLEVWQQKGLDEHAEAILAHVAAKVHSKDWTKDGGQYVPAPVVYLRSGAWDGADLATAGTLFEGAI